MNLREEIRINVIHKLIDDRNASYDDITGYIDKILSIFEKHGYRKVEVIDGYWSD